MLPFILDSRYSPDACRPAGAMLFGSLEQPIIQSDTITDRGCFMNLTVTRFYFHPSDPYRRTPVGIVSRRISPFPIVSCWYLYIYVYGWKKRKDPTMEFFFFFYSSLLPISRDFRDFSPQIGSSNRLLFPFTLREGIRSIIGLCREKTRNRKN